MAKDYTGYINSFGIKIINKCSQDENNKLNNGHKTIDVYYHAYCHCGNSFVVGRRNIDNIKSCGCLNKTRALRAAENEIGNTYGSLTIKSINYDETERKSHNKERTIVIVNCDCDCGKTDIPVQLKLLKENKTKSCGHLKINLNEPTCCSIGIVGEKYPVKQEDGRKTKEYNAWHGMLSRCYQRKDKRHETYADCLVDKRWHSFENFYEWLHSQENFDKWLNGKLWAVDKDILVKGNKIYSPETCCLVPVNVNTLFAFSWRKENRIYPVGVSFSKDKNKFTTACRDPIKKKYIKLGYFNTVEEAFYKYKLCKEDIIRQVAELEYKKGSITKICYEAMINYKIEITD